MLPIKIPNTFCVISRRSTQRATIRNLDRVQIHKSTITHKLNVGDVLLRPPTNFQAEDESELRSGIREEHDPIALPDPGDVPDLAGDPVPRDLSVTRVSARPPLVVGDLEALSRELPLELLKLLERIVRGRSIVIRGEVALWRRSAARIAASSPPPMGRGFVECGGTVIGGVRWVVPVFDDVGA